MLEADIEVFRQERDEAREVMQRPVCERNGGGFVCLAAFDFPLAWKNRSSRRGTQKKRAKRLCTDRGGAVGRSEEDN